MASIFVGITIAATLLAGAPSYIWTLERQGINTSIDRASQSFLNIFAAAPYIPLSEQSLDSTEQTLRNAVESNLADIYRSHERYIKSPTFLIGIPIARLPQQMPDNGEDVRVSRGYFQNITNLTEHVTFLEGRMASEGATWTDGTPSFEAVIGEQAKITFGLEVGDIVQFTPSLLDPVRADIEIVGILKPTDPLEEYWQHSPSIFIDPAPLDEAPDSGIEVDPEEPPLAVFISRRAFVEGVGRAFPGTLVSSNWFISIDKESLKDWDKTETRLRLTQAEREISSAMQGSAVFTGIERLLDRFERRSFFASVPLLLLMVVTAVTVLYYILMMVAYLVTSREADVALMRSRGVGFWHLARIYAMEGLAITSIATVAAPFLAMGAIALVGKLGYFDEITLGEFLPVSLRWTPFIVSGAVGLLCMTIYTVPGVIGARTGLIVHKLRSSRPPSEPFLQRYFVDIGLMVVVGIVFWELFSRGQIVSGGLFGAAGVNEALLFAPVLVLTVVALLFMRFFPLTVRFLSGESPILLHLTAAAISAAIALIIATAGVREGDGWGWTLRLAHLAAVGALYAGTWRAQHRRLTIAGFVGQAALIALFVYDDPPATAEVIYTPTVALVMLIPLQLLYAILRRLANVYPVWASMAIWRMARNPLQYSWLILLIVMVTGLGVLAATVGGTLDRSYEERILYEVAADLRITGIPNHFARGTEALERRYIDIPGIRDVSMALRTDGAVGATYAGSGFDVLAVESEDFPYFAWYRDDFSDRPLTHVMSLLRTGANLPPIRLPDDAETIQIWTHPIERYSNIYLWMAIQDSRGITETITFGPVGDASWSLMESSIPSHLRPPLNLASIQIYEPAFGPAGTAGTILMDDISVLARGGNEPQILDDFEGRNKWVPLSTSMLSQDTIGVTRRNVKNGEQSGAFVFGKDTDMGIRGFYRSPTGGPVPVVVSSSFIQRTGSSVGDSMIVSIFSRFIPVRIMDTVDYFPTMDPSGGGFMIADLEGLLQHLNTLTPIGNINPNELLANEAPGAEDEVYRLALSLAPTREMLHHRHTMLENFRLDPLITAGWRAMMIAALAIIIMAAALGYVTYLLSFSTQSRSEMGFLQALGFRSGQMTRLLGAEHLVIVALGLIIGTVAGFAMSGIMVSALAVTETGTPVVPPFVLTTNWAYMAAMYTGLAIVFFSALIWLARSVSRARLHEISRIEGE